MKTRKHLRFYVGLATAAVIPVSGMMTLTAPTAQAASTSVGYSTLEEVPTQLSNKAFTLKGKQGAKRIRTVKLVAKGGGVLTTTKTNADGRMAFKGVKLAKSTSVRIEAPRVFSFKKKEFTSMKKATDFRDGKKREAQRYTKKIQKAERELKKTKRKTKAARSKRNKLVKDIATYTNAREAAREFAYGTPAELKPLKSKWLDVAVASRATVTAASHPSIASAGKHTETAPNGTIITLRSMPEREGRYIALQEKRGDSWRTVESKRSDGAGYATFEVTSGKTYRGSVRDDATRLPAAESTPLTAKKFSRVFVDEFSGNSLNKVWNFEKRGLGVGTRNCATISDPSTISVSGGTLKLGVALDKTRTGKCEYVNQGVARSVPYMLNSMVSTGNRFTFTTGYASARIKVQADEGMHSGFWSLPNGAMTYGDPRKGVEYDIMEHFGDQEWDNPIAASTHWYRSATDVETNGRWQKLTKKIRGEGKKFSDEYHIFTLQRTADTSIFYMDGKEFYRTKADHSTAPQNLMLSMLTSEFELFNMKNANDTAKVDWVQVWK